MFTTNNPTNACHPERSEGSRVREPRGNGRSLVALGMTVFATIIISASALAKPTQEDVFKSIQTNVGESSDPKTLLAILAVLAGVVLVLVMLGNRRKRVAQPKSLNHQGKLLKEVLGEIDLKASE